MREPRVIHPSPHDPTGIGEMYREPGKRNAHIPRLKSRLRREARAMATKTDSKTTESTADKTANKSAAEKAEAQADIPEPEVDATSIVSDRFTETTEKTFSVGKVDPLTSSHFKESKEPRFGVTVDEGPVPTVDEDGKRAIEKARAAERSEAEKFKVYPDRD